MTFSATILAARDKLGYTQAELADAIGVSPRTVFRWEKDEEPTDIKKRGALGAIQDLLTRKPAKNGAKKNSK